MNFIPYPLTKITPTEVDGQTAHFIDIVSVNCRLNTFAIVSFTYVTEDIKLIKGVNMQITRDEYAAWGFDDDYILELTLTKNGLTKIS
jgi:hypothetical protein